MPSGNFTIDEDILKHQGISDFSTYATVPGTTTFQKGTWIFFLFHLDLFYQDGYTFQLPPTITSRL